LSFTKLNQTKSKAIVAKVATLVTLATLAMVEVVEYVTCCGEF